MEDKVKVWEESATIPTYEIGKAEKNPIFIEKRVYQGSSGVIYPFPVIEKVSDKKKDKVWKAVYLENKYLKVMILPELGGRVQMAYDKMKQRHFVYHNEVIKPALVGLAGPWISGGIEFNWPQHHRPGTYDPVDYTIEENADGSKTIWCSEVERMYRTKGMAGFTLHPSKAYLEIKVKLYNRTSQPQSFLWWANPAVSVNDHYQSVFPPDVNAVFDHGKRDVSTFPIATGEYYKVDYSSGVDISMYKNIPVPTSYMAIQSGHDFVGGYENDSKGGILHVANHHVSPGKKQWTWGHGDFGRAWDRNLTDRNGPYIELMCGVYTDNQPDFSWLMPHEEKTFEQYFMPYRDLGVVKNATKEAMVNMDISNNQALIKAFTTAEYPGSTIRLESSNKILLDEIFDFHPGTSYTGSVNLNAGLEAHQLKLSIITSAGRTLVSWQAEAPELKPIPESAKAALSPKDIKHNERLFLTGLHLEQYNHATYNPVSYYKEAIRRDPGDARCNNALGMLYLRRGRIKRAEQLFRTAVQRIIERNPNPYDGEPYFNLGLALQYQGKYDEAYDAFHKSVWNAAWMDSGYFHLAQIACIQKDWDRALELIDRSLVRNWHNHKGRHLKAAILRNLGRKDEALSLIEDSLKLDHFNFGILEEKHLVTGHPEVKQERIKLMRGNHHTYIEYALDYTQAGMYDEAISLINEVIIEVDPQNVYPLALYYKAWFQLENRASEAARETLKEAQAARPDYCFPHQLESVLVLEKAIELNPSDPFAPYYLGNFWYNARQHKKAICYWEQSASLNDLFPTVHRNLALAYFNKMDEKDKALAEMEKAFAQDTSDSRVLMELDQLYKKLNRPIQFRLEFLQKHPIQVSERDDLYLERIALLNGAGKYEEAYDLIMYRQFHPWEGGEGKVSGQYVLSLVELGKKSLGQSQFHEAQVLLNKARIYPENIGEGKLAGVLDNEINYWLGCIYERLGELQEAEEFWEKASMGSSEPSAAMYYNDNQPDQIFYQGMALLKSGKENEALSRFNKLISYGEDHIFDKVEIEYFAVSLPDLLIWEEDLQVRNTIHCKYLMGLGFLGKGENDRAKQLFNSILDMEATHSGALVHLKLCK